MLPKHHVVVQPVTKSRGIPPLLSFLFLNVQSAFCLLAVCFFLCSLTPLAVVSVYSSPRWAAAVFTGLLPLAAVACVSALFQSMRWRAWKESPMLSCFPGKEISCQGRWSSGSFPWFFQFLNPLFGSPSAFSLHQPVSDRKWASHCKPAVPWQLLVRRCLDSWGQSHCGEYWSRIYMSDVSLPSSREASCEIQKTA